MNKHSASDEGLKVVKQAQPNSSRKTSQHRSAERTKSSKRNIGAAQGFYSTAEKHDLVDPERAYYQLLKQKSTLSDLEYKTKEQSIFRQWALHDLKGLNSLLSDDLPKDTLSSLIPILTKAWVSDDIEESFIWLESLAQMTIDEGLIKNAYVTIMRQYAKSSPKDAVLIFNELNSKDTQRSLVGALAGAYAKENYLDSLQWVLALKDNGVREMGLETIISSLSPIEMDETVLKTLLDNEAQLPLHTLGDVFAQYGQTHPIEASNYLQHISDEMKPIAVSSFLANWYRQDPAQAMTWVESLPSGLLNDVAVKSIVRVASSTDPSKALSLVSQMAPGEDRDALIKSVIRRSSSESISNIMESESTFNGTRDYISGLIQNKLTDQELDIVIPN